MKILMLTPYLPYPPSEGGQVRSYNLIKLLSRRHEITLVSFTREHNTEKQIAHMKKYCRRVIVFKRGKAWTLENVLRTGFSPYPFLVAIYYSPDVKPVLSREIREGNYDLIHAETFYAMPYLPVNNLPTVLVEQTIMSRIFGHHIRTEPRYWFRPFQFIDVLKIRFWERHFWKKADRLVAVSNEDAEIMRSTIKGIKVNVVPNGVGEDFSNLSRKLHYNHKILYMGNYKWIQNWEAVELLAKKVFPIIKKKITDAELYIAGQFPTDAVRSLGKDDIHIVELRDDDSKGVVKSYLDAGIFVAPMHAPGGTRLKILAAMASMVPVVTTPIGAEGYGAKDGESILIGQTPEELANKTVKLLENKNLYQKIAYSARYLVDTKFSWEPIAKDLEAIYKEMVNERKS